MCVLKPHNLYKDLICIVLMFVLSTKSIQVTQHNCTWAHAAHAEVWQKYIPHTMHPHLHVLHN